MSLSTAGQRNTNQDMRHLSDSLNTQTTRSVFEGPPAYTLSPEPSSTSNQNDECPEENVNHGFDNPPAYDTIETESSPL